MAKIFNDFHFQIWWPCLFIFITCMSFTAWAKGSKCYARARALACNKDDFF
jgi:hypothetical protein